MKQVKDALARSGYLLELRIQRVLENAAYFVDANTAYQDPNTKKSRELDLYGIGGKKLTRTNDFLFTVFLIECVNNPQPLVFLTKEPIIGFLYHYDVKLSGLPVKIFVDKKEDEWDSLSEFLSMEKYHHYCKGRIATQYCSFTRKGATSQWMAQHDTAHFEVIQKLCDAVNYYRDHHFKSLDFREDGRINIQIYYPLLVVQGDLLDARPGKKTVKLIKANHIQYRRTMIHRDDATEYQIDVVQERFFARYLDMIETEIENMSRRIRRKKHIFQASIDKIVEKTKRLKSAERIRQAMDY